MFFKALNSFFVLFGAISSAITTDVIWSACSWSPIQNSNAFSSSSDNSWVSDMFSVCFTIVAPFLSFNIFYVF